MAKFILAFRSFVLYLVRPFLRNSGHGAVRLARLLWEQEVAGSNPAAPTEREANANYIAAPVAQSDRATAF